jgi:hypothetical protein
MTVNMTILKITTLSISIKCSTHLYTIIIIAIKDCVLNVIILSIIMLTAVALSVIMGSLHKVATSGYYATAYIMTVKAIVAKDITLGVIKVNITILRE